MKQKKRKNNKFSSKRKSNSQSHKLVIWNNNYAGLKSKLESFDHVLETVRPSIFMGQETKMGKNSQIRTKNSQNYRIFQLRRQEIGV